MDKYEAIVRGQCNKVLPGLNIDYKVFPISEVRDRVEVKVATDVRFSIDTLRFNVRILDGELRYASDPVMIVNHYIANAVSELVSAQLKSPWV